MTNKILIDTKEKFDNMLSKLKSNKIVIDTETTGLIISKLKLVGISFYDGGDTAYYVSIGHFYGNNVDINYCVEKLKELLEYSELVIGHNLVYDSKVLHKYNLDLQKYTWFDTMVAAHLCYEERSSLKLKKLAVSELKMESWGMEKDVGNFENAEFSDQHKMKEYSCKDVIATWGLYELYLKEMTRKDLLKLFDLEMKFIKVIQDMEEVGVKLDVDKLKQFEIDIKKDIKELEQKIGEFIKPEQQTLFGFAQITIDLNSPKQLGNLLYNKLKLPILEYTDKGQAATGIEALEKLKDKHQIIPLIIEHRKLSKLLNAFIISIQEKVDIDGRIRTSFHDCGTKTGRLSSSSINCQQLPHPGSKYDIRDCLIATPGYTMIAIDYSQEELRMAAHVSQDPTMIDAYEHNKDLHLTVANKVFNLGLKPEDLIDGTPGYNIAKKKYKEQRGLSKFIGFGLLYGAGPKGLSQLTNKSEDECKILMDNYFREFPLVKKKIQETEQKIKKDKYIKNLFGRYRHFREINNAALRQGFNYLIQGCIHKDMKILTRNGLQKISELPMNKIIELWDGENWATGKPIYTGKKRVVEVKFVNGQRIKVSKDHKFLTVNTANDFLWKTTREFSKLERVVISKEYNTKDKFKLEYIPDTLIQMKPWNKLEKVHNIKDMNLDIIKDKFSLGLLLGRFASDGTFLKPGAAWIIAQHEYNILPILENILKPLNYTTIEKQKNNISKKGIRYAPLKFLNIYSIKILKQLKNLNIKDEIHHSLFIDKELLRGYLRGFFDGDGGVVINHKNNKISYETTTIHVCFGKRHKKTTLPWDIQQALLLFGIRSRVHIYKDSIRLRVRQKDNERFKSEIGFINEKKNNKIIIKHTKEAKYGIAETVECVKYMYNEEDMYDIVDSSSGKFMCQGLIVHNSCSDLLRKAMVELKQFIEQNNNEARILITVHDEILFEVPDDKVKFYEENFKRIMENVVKLRVKLTAEAGIGRTYSEAK